MGIHSVGGRELSHVGGRGVVSGIAKGIRREGCRDREKQSRGEENESETENRNKRKRKRNKRKRNKRKREGTMVQSV